MSRERSSPYPALAGSVALHLGVLLFVLVLLPWLTKPLHVGEVVPVTLMTAQDLGSLKNAVEVPIPAPAATPEPVPDAPVQTAAPEPAPQPTPPVPTPPKPTAAPAKTPPPKPAPTPTPTPTPAKAPPKPEKSFDLDALAASLAPANRAAGVRQSSAARGAARPETAVKAQASSGVGDVASTGAQASIGAELERIWNLSFCDASGATDGNIVISIRIAPNGYLLGEPESSVEGTSNQWLKVASENAKRAVHQLVPYVGLPPGLYGRKFPVNFNPKSACQRR